jgi:hypothetical protein
MQDVPAERLRATPNLAAKVNQSQGVNSQKLNPRWVETLMGLPIGWVMPSCKNPITPIAEQTPSMGGGQLDDTRSSQLHGVSDQQWSEDPASWESGSYPELYTSCDNRTDELRLLGNGVCPPTAELAWRTLLNQLNQTT